MQRIACIFWPYFFTSLARRDNIQLLKKPLIIHRENRVAGFSSELAGYTLEGLPVAKARGRCPDALFWEYDYSLYKQEQEKYLQLLTGFSPLIEPLNEQECFFDLTGSDISQEMARLKTSLEERSWGPCIIGSGKNRLLARLAVRWGLSGENIKLKSFNQVNVLPGQEITFLSHIPLVWDWTLSNRVVARMQSLGFVYLGELQKLSQDNIVRLLGKESTLAFWHSRGIDYTPMTGLYPPEKISWQQYFEGEVSDREILRKTLKMGASFLDGVLKERRKGCRLVRLRLSSDDDSWEAERLFSHGCYEKERLMRVLNTMLNGMEVSERVSGLVIEASALYNHNLSQPDIFTLDRKSTNPGRDLEIITESLKEKFSQGIRIGTEEINRREQVLSFWDPWRFL
ncbi:MAG: DNA polymerase Y family protein [Chitinophagales bacterium]